MDAADPQQFQQSHWACKSKHSNTEYFWRIVWTGLSLADRVKCKHKSPMYLQLLTPVTNSKHYKAKWSV